MPAAPDPRLLESFNAPTTRLIRRVEICEFDGITPWKRELWPYILTDGGGSVTADIARDEMRAVDLVLDNVDGELDPVPGKLWYDKVVKVFYGIVLDEQPRDPAIVIVEEFEGQAIELKRLLNRAGINSVYIDTNPDAQTYQDFDIVVSITKSGTAIASTLRGLVDSGQCSVVTFALEATSAGAPGVIGATGATVTTTEPRRFRRIADSPDRLSIGWDPQWEISSGETIRKITAPAAGAVSVAETWDVTNGASFGALVGDNAAGTASWAHVQIGRFDPTHVDSGETYLAEFLAAVIHRVDGYVPRDKWETQIGEFVLDVVEDADEFGDQVKLTGRDYVARCLSAKLSKATTFTSDQKIEDVIRVLALNSRISKINLAPTGKTLGKDMTWERDTDRWTIIKEIALANNYEAYFTGDGYLTMRPQQDPALTAPSLVLRAGPGGNLVSRGRKTSSAQIFNIVTVVGESSDTTVPLVYGEAVNNNPASPTRVGGGDTGDNGGIGPRVKNISSPLITTEQQAKELAETMLSVSSLEEFEMNFASVLYPWVEPGEVLEWNDRERDTWGPTRYLITSLTLPLDLGPMSGAGKRVTKVA